MASTAGVLLLFVHACMYVYRDIKPENMLLSPVATCGGEGSSPSWRLKVIDYGCSAFCIPGQRLREAVGTVRLNPRLASLGCSSLRLNCDMTTN